MSFGLSSYWYRKSLHPGMALLLPFSWLFQLTADLRRLLYRHHFLKTHHFKVPVIVVGNITVGGTGKTPFVIALAKFLQEMGYHPGIVSRGVGGQRHKKPYRVQWNDAADWVGDEALLLLRNTNCPLVVGIDRVSAVRELLQTTSCNVIISDDGLQHYRLGRSFEIAMIDGLRELGNQCLLPAGPLREKPSRLRQVDLTIINENSESNLKEMRIPHVEHAYQMLIQPEEIVAIKDPGKSFSLEHFPDKKIHLIAGIGNPERFFMLFKNAGFEIIPHVFRDHYLYRRGDFDFNDTYPIIMTEKDAVKVNEFADHRYWFLRITAKMDHQVKEKILKKLSRDDEHLQRRRS